jgi:CRISPR-associated endoribonuclease Cas6
MPTRWRITAAGADPARVKAEHLHAVVSGWFDSDEEAHRAPAKAYTVSPPAPGAAGTVFEIGLLDDGLSDRLLTRAAPGVRVRFGSQSARIAHVPRQTAAVPWTQLATASGAAGAWCLRYVTPVTFRRGNTFTPWPAPNAVLGGLRAAWTHYAWAGLPPLELNLSQNPVWVSDIDGANDVLRVNGMIVSGFVGRIRYVCDADPQVVAAVDRLMRLAPFSGVGAYTTRGFGLTHLEPTWPRRPRR